MAKKTWTLLVTGGAGYVGAVLVPQLLAEGHRVTVLDLYLYGEDVLDAVKDDPGLRQIKGDVRDPKAVETALAGCDAVIHLACISNDPSFELNPTLGRSINLDAFRPLVQAAKRAGVKRFVYASSSSVYGVKDGVEVTEDLPLEPLTDYSRFKAECERILEDERGPGFVTLTVRPATVCGASPRQRLDVIVNILTNHAVNTGRIKVTGGPQKRPNIHIQDMCRFYLQALQWDDAAIDGKIYNVSEKNHTVTELAEMVRDIVGGGTEIDVVSTNDPRSYHISAERIRQELGFAPHYTIRDAVETLSAALRVGTLTDPMNNPRYFNIKMMQLRDLK